MVSLHFQDEVIRGKLAAEDQPDGYPVFVALHAADLKHNLPAAIQQRLGKRHHLNDVFFFNCYTKRQQLYAQSCERVVPGGGLL